MRSPRNVPEAAAPPHHPAGGRRKGTVSRAWRVVSASGPSYLEEVGKHSIMRRTGLPPRDLRVLDPLLSYPSTILGRERAIVINLEHIKAIITATEVLVANSKDSVVAAFVDELQSRVAGSPGDPRQAVEFDELDAEVMAKAVPSDLSSPDHNGTKSCGRKNSKKQVKLTSSLNHGTPEDSTMHMPDIHKDGGIKVLPFEFKALEVCLESACKSLENEALTLDQRAYPALDQLTTKVSTLNLERVRQIKSNLVAISGRVQKVRDELEHLLDDDMDMAEMYLTEKLTRQPAGETSSRIDVDNDEIDLDDDRYDDLKNEMESNHGSLTGFKPNIEELEMLLEAYFVQIDGTLNKLSTLREYVDDTEDYINIMLDDKQNQLLQMGVMLSTATLVITAGVVVVGLFGMNITVDLFNAPYITFWETTFGTIGGCIVVYILAIGWAKKSGLLQ